ncbi:MAG: hypothetical protein ACRDIX_00745 [Actinomycetota bacterium]
MRRAHGLLLAGSLVVAMLPGCLPGSDGTPWLARAREGASAPTTPPEAGIGSALRGGPELAGKLAEIQDLLDRRARALLLGDRPGFLAGLDHEAEGDFVERQELLFDGFQRLPLQDYRLDVSLDVFEELTASEELRRYGRGAQPTVLHVEQRYRLQGYDRQPALEDVFLTFVRRPAGWRMISDSDLDDLTIYSGRVLWEFGPIVTRESEHFLYVSHPDLAGAAGTILPAAQRALARVSAVWPLQFRKKVVILAPSESEELVRILQAQFDVDVFVAFAYSGLDRDREWDLVGHRIILHWDNFSAQSDAAQQSILTHELLHIATRELSGPFVPAFVDEGVAEWVTTDASTLLLAIRVGSGIFDRRLPLDHEFITGDTDDIVNSYQESYSFIRYADDRFGSKAVAEFYRRLGRPQVAAGTWRYHVDRAMRAAFGSGFGRLQRRWADWVMTSYGG